MTPDEYMKQYPNYCRKCDGWGFQTWIEHHDGPMYPGEPMQEPCECLENGSCPRCGSGIDTENTETYHCHNCHWEEGVDGIVDPPEALPDYDFDEEVPY